MIIPFGEGVSEMWEGQLLALSGRHCQQPGWAPASQQRPQVGHQTASTTTAAHTYFTKAILGTNLVVQWLRLHAFYCERRGFNPGWGTKILHATQHDREKLNKQDLFSNRKSDTCVYYRQILLKVTFCFLYHLVKSLLTLLLEPGK